MSDSPKRYWMSVVERDSPAAGVGEAENGDPDFVPTRRSFLKAAGFSLGALAVSSCRAPEIDNIPFVRQPDGIVPGRPVSYATTCGGCEAGCGLLVTNRDGRPIKIEGNPDHPLSGGATCAVGQASILGLYDSQRLQHPTNGGQPAAWADVDRVIVSALDRARQERRPVRILTTTITSPTMGAVIADFVGSFPDGRHVTYDPISASALLDAQARRHGVRRMPQYHLEEADVIVAIEADFLGSWVSPVQFTRAYTSRRRIDASAAAPAKSYHVQIESRLSLTGSNADRRLRVAPGEVAHLATHLAAKVAERAGAALPIEGLAASPWEPAIADIAVRLAEAGNRGLVISGSQDPRVQILCDVINQTIGAYGTTVDVVRPSRQRAGSDVDLAVLRAELARGDVGVLLVVGVNPAYDLPDGAAFAEQLRRVPLVVSTAERLDETAALAQIVCPDHHYLEGWGDAEPIAGMVSLAQPTIQPIYQTRATIESLAIWSGKPAAALELIRAHWQTAIHPRATGAPPFDVFWDRSLERGVAEVAAGRVAPATTALAQSAADDAGRAAVTVRPDPIAAEAMALVLYPTIGMLDGRHGHNAWLHELPDPVTKVTWDNYACVSPAAAARLAVADGDIVRVAAANDGTTIELPVFVQPGQHDQVVAIALGYGRLGTDRFGKIGPPWFEARRLPGVVGVNAAPLIAIADDRRQYAGRSVTIVKTGRSRQLASTQVHHSLEPPGSTERRPIIQETTLGALVAAAAASATPPGTAGDHPSPGPEHGSGDLWPDDHPKQGRRWGMSIDLNSCTGCSACVIACQSENNVPTVGQDEVRRNREMHWLRIDRYYSGSDEETEVAHQPMLCQHCNHAPCETVCPVLATVHSDEGLNQQVYNRCVGTRYCANNCPYKVRRFNWFDYPHEDRLQNLVFNPDVTVRSRGVMEKCTFCVQRIEAQTIEAKRLDQPLTDGRIKTACEQSCPAQAIVFGDLHDPNSRVSRLAESNRVYRVLEELNTQPAVRYLKLVRHDEPGGGGEASGG